jgi:hypothetical protein
MSSGAAAGLSTPSQTSTPSRRRRGIPLGAAGDIPEIRFTDRLLEGWAKWAYISGIDQRIRQVGILWGIPSERTRSHVLELRDDDFVYLDQRIALLPERLRWIVEVEYMTGGPSRSKAQKIGLAYLAYRQRLHAAQWVTFAYLMPKVYGWMAEHSV